jgi:hypothetical protein
MATGGARVSYVQDAIIVAGLMICIVVMGIVFRAARKSLAEAVAESERDLPQG